MRITVTAGELGPAAGRARHRTDSHLPDLLEEIGAAGEELARTVAPVLSGNFKGSITHEVERDAVTVGSTSRRAHIVESGRLPGKMPPPALLADLFGVPDDEAFLIARSIGQTGMDGHQVFEFTRRALELDIRDRTRRFSEQVVALARS